MMMLLSRGSSLENSNWKPSLSFVNLNGSVRILTSADMAEAKMVKFGNINAYVNYKVVPPLLKPLIL